MAASPRSGNGVCHYYGDRLTVNARYSFPSYASECLSFPLIRGKHRGRRRRMAVVLERGRKVGRTNPGVHALGSYTDGCTPPFSPASFRLAVIWGPPKRTYQIGPLVFCRFSRDVTPVARLNYDLIRLAFSQEYRSCSSSHVSIVTVV